MERSIPYAVLDNIIGFDDDHITPGEKLKKAVGEDPFGVATTVVKGVGKAAKSAFDRVLEEGPLDALTGSLSDYSRDLVGAGTRLKSGTQGYIDSGMTQAEARDKQISDALRLSELIPLMGSGVAGLRAGRVALPEAPFDSSRRSFLGGIAALPAVAAVAPDALSGALKSVGPKVARATSSLDVSVAKIKDLLKQKDLLGQQADTLRRDPNLHSNSIESVRKDMESFQVQDEIEEAARRALDDLSPTDLSNAADDSIEMISEQFSTSGVLQYDRDSPAFDKLMEQVKLRGMHTAKDSNGIDQFPYARNIYEDYYNPINIGEATIPRSVFGGPQSLNMVEDDFFKIMGSEGALEEFSEIGKLVENYTFENSQKALKGAISSPDYKDYKNVLNTNLNKTFPEGKIPVKRILNYTELQQPGRGQQAPISEYKNVDVDDVSFVSNFSEKEIIVKEGDRFKSYFLTDKKTEVTPPVGRTVAPDIVEKMKDLEISNFLQQIGLQEKEMIAEGASASEIDAMKEGFRQKIFKLQNENREDFSEDFFADGGEVMDGIGSLNETARGMSRGPRGIGAYQQFSAANR